MTDGVRALILVAALTRCAPLPEPVPPEPQPGAGCASMCLHLAQLGCPEGDASCLEVCDYAEEYGIDLHTECVSGVTSCDQVDHASSHGCGP